MKLSVYKRTIVKRSAPHVLFRPRVREWRGEPEPWRGPGTGAGKRRAAPLKGRASPGRPSSPGLQLWLTLGGERRRLALTKVRPAGEQRQATSLCSLGAPQQVAAAPSPGKPRTHGGAGRRRRSGTARGRRDSARTAGDRGGAWGPRGGGAASLGAAPGRGLCVAQHPLVWSTDSEIPPSGCPGPGLPPPGVPGADLALPLPPRSRTVHRPDRSTEEACAANGPVLPAFLCPAAWEVRPSYAVSRETAGMTATGWARTMANSTAVRVSGPNVPRLQDRAPSLSSRSQLRRTRLWCLWGCRLPFGLCGINLWFLEDVFSPPGSLKQFSSLSLGLLKLHFCCVSCWTRVPQLSFPAHLGVGDGLAENWSSETFPGLCASVLWTSSYQEKNFWKKLSFHSLLTALVWQLCETNHLWVPRGTKWLGALSGLSRGSRQAEHHLLLGAGNCTEILPVKWELGSWGNFKLRLLLKEWWMCGLPSQSRLPRFA